MPLYMDIHKNVDGLTAEAVADAHRKDLGVPRDPRYDDDQTYEADHYDWNDSWRIRRNIPSIVVITAATATLDATIHRIKRDSISSSRRSMDFSVMGSVVLIGSASGV